LKERDLSAQLINQGQMISNLLAASGFKQVLIGKIV
jgi:hypothetical protein